MGSLAGRAPPLGLPGSGDGLSASKYGLIPPVRFALLTSLGQEHNAFLCEAQAPGEGGELFLDLGSGGLGAAWGSGRSLRPPFVWRIPVLPAPELGGTPNRPHRWRPRPGGGHGAGTRTVERGHGESGPGPDTLGVERGRTSPWSVSATDTSWSAAPVWRQGDNPAGPVSPNPEAQKIRGAWDSHKPRSHNPLGGGRPEEALTGRGKEGRSPGCRGGEGRVGAQTAAGEGHFMGAAGQAQAGPGGAATPPRPVLPGRVAQSPRPASVAPGRTHEGWCSCSSLGGQPGAAAKGPGLTLNAHCGQVILGSGVGCWGCPQIATLRREALGPGCHAPLPT